MFREEPDKEGELAYGEPWVLESTMEWFLEERRRETSYCWIRKINMYFEFFKFEN